MPNLWNLVHDYFVDLCAQPGETLEARITRQVNQIKGQAFSVADRVTALEAKSNNMDAYYMKTLGTALKSHFDGKIDSLKEGYTHYDERLNLQVDRMNELQNSMARTEVELAKVHSRLSAFIRQFRQLGEE